MDVSRPVQESVTDYEIFTGSVQGEKLVNLQAQVTGYLLAKPLAVEGSDVKEGEVVFKIDPQVYAAILAQADARLSNQTKATFQTDEDIYQRDCPVPIATPEGDSGPGSRHCQGRRPRRSGCRRARSALRPGQPVVHCNIRAPFNSRISSPQRRSRQPHPGDAGFPTSWPPSFRLDPIYAFFDVDER